MNRTPPVGEILSRLKQALGQYTECWRLAAGLMRDLAARWGELLDGNGRPVEHPAAYVAATLGLSKARVYQLRDAGRVLQIIEDVNPGSQDGVNPGRHPLDPSCLCEKVLRPLTRLLHHEPKLISDAWREAVRLAGEDGAENREVRVRSRHTKQAVVPHLPRADAELATQTRLVSLCRRASKLAADARQLPEAQRRRLLDQLAGELGLTNAADAPRPAPIDVNALPAPSAPIAPNGRDRAADAEDGHGRGPCRELVAELAGAGVDEAIAESLSRRYKPGRIRSVCRKVQGTPGLNNPGGRVVKLLQRSRPDEMTEAGPLVERLEQLRRQKRIRWDGGGYSIAPTVRAASEVLGPADSSP